MSNEKEQARVDALIADIQMANNGYLVIDYMSADYAAYVKTIAATGVVTITNGTVHLPATRPEFFKAPLSNKPFALKHDGPDYEGAILARQAAAGLYD